MDIITIFEVLKKYGLVALTAVVAFTVLLGAVYFIYKKLFHGTKTFSKGQWITTMLLLGWFVVVLGLTMLNRGANYMEKINFALFSGYKNAWNEWSGTEYQLIIFNMLMFFPLGLLVPFLTKKGEKLSVVCLVSFLVTLFIEVLQFVTGRGIFELYDLLHNFVGSMFGYFVCIFILDLVRGRKIRMKHLLCMLAVPLFFVALTAIATVVYHIQPYGNLPFLPAEKQNMSIVTVENQMQFSDEEQVVPVFKNAYANDYARIREISKGFAELVGFDFDRPVRTDGSNKLFRSSASEGLLTAFTKNGSWSYTNWQEAVHLSENQASGFRETIESWLTAHDLLPETAVFSLQNGTTLRWDVEMPLIQDQNSDFEAGIIMAEIGNDGKIAVFSYEVTKYLYIDDVSLLPVSEAYDQILDGNFEQYNPFEKGDTLVVTGCSLGYEPDTKGYLRPVYRFEGYINRADNVWEGVVSAK